LQWLLIIIFKKNQKKQQRSFLFQSKGGAMKIAIVGSGISGLSLSWFLKKKLPSNASIKIFEASSRSGGCLRSAYKQGFLLEYGPNSLRVRGESKILEDFLKKTGLENKMIVSSSAAKKRFIWFKEKLCLVEPSFKELLCSPLFKGVRLAWLKDMVAPRSTCDDESIHAFISRRFGRNVAERFFDPLVKGIWSGNIHELSMRSCFPLLASLEKEYRSLIRGAFSSRSKSPKKKSSIVSFQGGMETITKCLSKEASKELFLNTSIKGISNLENQVELKFSDSQETFDHVFLCLPPNKLEAIFDSGEQKIINNLKQFKLNSIKVVHVGFENKVLKESGFGHLVPSSENTPILGCIWSSRVFPGLQSKKQELLTFMVKSDYQGDVESLIDSSLNNQLQITQKPLFLESFDIQQAINQPIIGHSNVIQNLENSFKKFSPNIYLLGGAYYGVSLGDCINHSHKTACDFFDSLSL
jgi:protoporphyrinogen/coproporphyrinogen III oxidase